MAIVETGALMPGSRGGLGRLIWDVLTLPANAFPPSADRSPVPLLAALSMVNLMIAWGSVGPAQGYSLLLVERAGKTLAPHNEYIVLQAVTIATLVAGLVVPPVLWLAESALARLGGLLVDRRVRFRQVLLVTVMAGIPVTVGSVVKAMLVNLSPPSEFVRVQAGLVWLAGGLPEEGLAYFVLGSLDPFGIWSLALLGYGLARLYGRPARQGWTAVFAVWILVLATMRVAQ